MTIEIRDLENQDKGQLLILAKLVNSNTISTENAANVYGVSEEEMKELLSLS